MFLKINFDEKSKKIKFKEEYKNFSNFLCLLEEIFKIKKEDIKISFIDIKKNEREIQNDNDITIFLESKKKKKFVEIFITKKIEKCFKKRNPKLEETIERIFEESGFLDVDEIEDLHKMILDKVNFQKEKINEKKGKEKLTREMKEKCERKKIMEEERVERELLLKQRIFDKILDEDRYMRERKERERFLEEKIEQRKLQEEKEKIEREKLKKEKIEQEKLEREKIEQEKLEKEKIERREKLQKEKSLQNKQKKIKLESEKLKKHQTSEINILSESLLLAKTDFITKITNLEKKLKNFQKKVIHKNIFCDICKNNKKFIEGIRYKCLICEDFDLCQNCEKLNIHSHTMIKCNFEINNKLLQKMQRAYKNEVVVKKIIKIDPKNPKMELIEFTLGKAKTQKDFLLREKFVFVNKNLNLEDFYIELKKNEKLF